MGSFCSSVCQEFDGPASLLFRCQCWCVQRERLWWWLQPLCVTQQYRLASMAPWLSSTGISHHNLLPHIPSIRLSTVNSSPRTRIAPQSLNSSSQLLRLPEDQRSCPVYVWLWQGLSDPFHLSCHRSAVSLSALNASPLTQTIARMWGLDPCLSSPTHRGQVQAY